jgi:PIN domain
VQAIDPACIGAKAVSFVLLVGAKQTKLDLDVVEHLLKNAASVQLIRLKSSGKNALDFTVAYYLGRAAATHPNDYFHIVSKDQGFDPLIEHLRAKHIRIRRHESFATLTFSASPPPVAPVPVSLPELTKAAVPTPAVVAPPPSPPPAARATIENPPVPSEAVRRILEHFNKNPANRPRRKTTLITHAVSFLGNKVTPAGAEALVDLLVRLGYISINEKGGLSYHLKL